MIAPLLVLVCVACSDDDGPRDIGQTAPNATANNLNNQNNENNVNNEAPPLVIDCDEDAEVGLSGSVFVDVDDRANSAYDLPDSDMREALPGVEIRLRDDEDQVWVTQTCDDGQWRFGLLPADRRYFVDAVFEDRVTSVNDSRRVWDSIDEGELSLVVFGDSIPVFGGTPWFPNLMRDSMTDFVSVELTNVAVSGSTSDQWLPGESFFNSDLAPELDEADVLVFSLGGNDLQQFATTLQSSPDPLSRIGELQPLVEEVTANLKTIIAEIRSLQPDADIVWILYPNYATSDQWAALLGEFADAGETVVDRLLKQVRTALADEPDLILIDMLEATRDMDLDLLLFDPLHLNTAGHAFYAQEILKTLGFVPDVEGARYDFAVEAE